MSSLKWLAALAKLLGDKLPQAWPHILAISVEVKALLILVGVDIGLAGVAAEPVNKDGKALIELLDKHGIDHTQSRKAVESLATLDAQL